MSREQGPPESGRGAPNLFGDMTSKAADWPALYASFGGSHSVLGALIIAIFRRPPAAVTMRPAAIAVGGRRQGARLGGCFEEAAAT